MTYLERIFLSCLRSLENMELLRTPDEQFENLPGYDFEPHYFEHNDARVHYIDEGEGEPILLLHGEPSWCYLYRKFFPVLTPRFRALSMDFLGFGRSDKPTKMKDYDYKFHLDTLLAFLDHTGLDKVTIVVQDWGGLVGLGLLGQVPEKFARVVIMNTFLPIGNRPFPLAFKAWRTYAKYHPNLPIGGIIKKGTYQPLSDEVIAAYNAPFPDKKYKAGAKKFPLMVPGKPTDDGVSYMKHAREVLKGWQKPALVMFSDKDPIMRGGDKWFRGNIPTANDQPFIEIKNAGHFLQEDKGEEIALHIKEFMERTPIDK